MPSVNSKSPPPHSGLGHSSARSASQADVTHGNVAPPISSGNSGRNVVSSSGRGKQMLPPRPSNAISADDAIREDSVARLPSQESPEQHPAEAGDPTSFASNTASTDCFNDEVERDNDRKPSALPRYDASESKVSEEHTLNIIPGERVASRRLRRKLSETDTLHINHGEQIAPRPSKRLRREVGSTSLRLTELPLELLKMTAPYLQVRELKQWAISHRIFNNPSLRRERHCLSLSMEMVDRLIKYPEIREEVVQYATSVKLPREISREQLKDLILSGQLDHISGISLSGCYKLGLGQKREEDSIYQLLSLKNLKKIDLSYSINVDYIHLPAVVQALGIEDINLSGAAIDEETLIGCLHQKLKKLELRGYDLTGITPRLIDSITMDKAINLEHLVLFSSIRGVKDNDLIALSKLKRLSTLEIDGSRITTGGLNSRQLWGGFQALKRFHITNYARLIMLPEFPPINGKENIFRANNSMLESIAITNSYAAIDDFRYYSYLPNLSALDLRSVPEVDKNLDVLVQCKNLKSLGFSLIEEPDIPSLKCLTSFFELERLCIDIRQGYVNSLPEVLDTLPKLPRLKELVLAYPGGLQVEDIKVLANKMPALEKLQFNAAPGLDQKSLDDLSRDYPNIDFVVDNFESPLPN